MSCFHLSFSCPEGTRTLSFSLYCTILVAYRLFFVTTPLQLHTSIERRTLHQINLPLITLSVDLRGLPLPEDKEEVREIRFSLSRNVERSCYAFCVCCVFHVSSRCRVGNHYAASQ